MASNLPPSGDKAYLLNRIFTFPSDNGPRTAISLSVSDADRMLSFYTILVKSTLVQLWTIIVIIGIHLSLRQSDHSHNTVVTATGILNAKRPLEISELSFNYLLKLRRKTPKRLLTWLAIALLALAVTTIVPTFVGPYLVVGHGAPVNPAWIYIPNSTNLDSKLFNKYYSLEVPSTLRAVGSVQLAGLTSYKDHVQIDNPEKLEDKGNGEIVNRYRYRYNVTAKEFGLQHYDGLTFHVEGSCVTEYGWRSEEDSGLDSNGDYRDEYHLWNNRSDSNIIQIYGLYDAPMPVAYFRNNEVATDDGSQRNTSYAIAISSFDRISFTEGTDPFYLTTPSADEIATDGTPMYIIKQARPLLSCWQSDTWVYKDQHFSVTSLNRPNNSLGGLPNSLNTIFTHSLTLPKITTLGSHLRTSALISASTARNEVLDAGSANIYTDLTRLIIASYVATTTTLLDTTLYRAGNNTAITDVPNVIGPNNLHDAAGFVLYTENARAISLSALISIPLVWLAIFLIAWVITSYHRFPWFYVQGLQATLLYSLLDQKSYEASSTFAADGGEKSDGTSTDQNERNKHQQGWNQSGTIAYYKGDGNNRTCFIPSVSTKNFVVPMHNTAMEAPSQRRKGSTTNPASQDKGHRNISEILVA